MPAQDPGSTDKDLRIKDVKAYPTSYPIPPGQSVTLGIGRAVKRDAVVVKVTTEGGLVGYGESHHGRAHTAIAALVNTTLRQLILGMDAADVVGVLEPHLFAPAREPRHGRRLRDGDERHRHGAVGHPRQGDRLAALQAARRRAEADPGLCRRRLARLPGAFRAGRRGAAASRRRLQGGEAARRRHARARPRAHRSGAQGGRRRHRHPHRRQHGLHA